MSAQIALGIAALLFVGALTLCAVGWIKRRDHRRALAREAA